MPTVGWTLYKYFKLLWVKARGLPEISGVQKQRGQFLITLCDPYLNKYSNLEQSYNFFLFI